MDKSRRISIRLSEEELKEIKSRSDKLDMTISDFVRSLGTKDAGSMVIDPEIHGEIRQLHEDARRIAECLNGADIDADERRQFIEQLEKIRSCLMDISILIHTLEKGAPGNGDNEAPED